MGFIKNIGSWFGAMIERFIDWISFLFLVPIAIESYYYFFEYEKMFEPNALYFQNYSEINWVAFIFLLGHFNRINYIGRVALAGIFFVLVGNTIHLHIGFSDSHYFIFYIASIYVFIFCAYIWKIFQLIEQAFTVE